MKIITKTNSSLSVVNYTYMQQLKRASKMSLEQVNYFLQEQILLNQSSACQDHDVLKWHLQFFFGLFIFVFKHFSNFSMFSSITLNKHPKPHILQPFYAMLAREYHLTALCLYDLLMLKKQRKPRMKADATFLSNSKARF